jgi:DNA-binding NtrC family response regulator
MINANTPFSRQSPFGRAQDDSELVVGPPVASQPPVAGLPPEGLESHDRQTGGDRRLASVLIADDQPDVLEALRLLLKGEGYRVESAGSPGAILDAIDSADFDAILMDLNYARDTTSGREGLDLLTQIRAHDPTLPVVVMTAWGSVDVAVEAMRRGARDFVQKPWENARLLVILRTQVELARALRRQQRLEAENRSLKPDGRPLLIAEAPTMRPVLELISRVGPSEANVLITGENGTGKGTVAQAIHAVSSRTGKGLVMVNAGGLSEGVFESELFGHVKGAFTDAKADRVGRFELADGGTLFLDEIANVPLNLQPKLLRVLETGDFERVGSSRTRHVNVRIISATNANLSEEVGSGRFRQDLLFRLNTIEIQLPPLRERREDIPALAMHFLRQHTQRYRKGIGGFEQPALQSLVDHPWPGNIRELDHAVERGVLMTRGSVVRLGDLGLRLDRDSSSRVEDMSLEEVEGFLIKKAMARFGGNVSQAAKTLGLSRSALYRRLQRYGL